ncbi:hypothetical protein [Thalassospira xiamenensis]|uniref:Uncharacterized protein n=1 Tax=Thalassospira xiamenensis TaxID=220697 RepID=A0A285TH42_9PROT|nr:hypothetical protein [Thalassospira xiamenensis]SOC21554.1 hypothetical protein SAMN05428964_103438 [Thalassospira xiamenensis]
MKKQDLAQLRAFHDNMQSNEFDGFTQTVSSGAPSEGSHPYFKVLAVVGVSLGLAMNAASEWQDASPSTPHYQITGNAFSGDDCAFTCVNVLHASLRADEALTFVADTMDVGLRRDFLTWYREASFDDDYWVDPAVERTLTSEEAGYLSYLRANYADAYGALQVIRDGGPLEFVTKVADLRLLDFEEAMNGKLPRELISVSLTSAAIDGAVTWAVIQGEGALTWMTDDDISHRAKEIVDTVKMPFSVYQQMLSGDLSAALDIELPDVTGVIAETIGTRLDKVDRIELAKVNRRPNTEVMDLVID